MTIRFAKLNLFRMSMSPIGNLIITALTLPFIRMMGGDRAWIIVAIWRYHRDRNASGGHSLMQRRFHPALQKRLRDFLCWPEALRKQVLHHPDLHDDRCIPVSERNGTCTTLCTVHARQSRAWVSADCQKIPWIIGVIIRLLSEVRQEKHILQVQSSASLPWASPIVPTIPLLVVAVMSFGEAPFYGCIHNVGRRREYIFGKLVSVSMHWSSPLSQSARLNGLQPGSLATEEVSGFTPVSKSILRSRNGQNLYIWGVSSLGFWSI